MKPSLLPLLFALVGCSDAASSSAPPSSDASTSDDTAHADGGSDAVVSADTTPPQDVTSGDASAPSDAVVAPDASDPREPHPPAGARRCGDGAITSADSRMVCMARSSIIDSTLLPDGGRGSVERQCDAVTVGGGRWEAWCTGEQVYVWAYFQDLRPTGSYRTCGSITALSVGLGYYEHAELGRGGGGNLSARGVPDYFFDQARPTGVVVDATIRTPSAGTGNFFISAYQDVRCVGMVPMGGRGSDVIIGGAAFRWNPMM